MTIHGKAWRRKRLRRQGKYVGPRASRLNRAARIFLQKLGEHIVNSQEFKDAYRDILILRGQWDSSFIRAEFEK